MCAGSGPVLAIRSACTSVPSSLPPATSLFYTFPDVHRSELPLKAKGDATGTNTPKTGKQERPEEEPRPARRWHS